MGNSDSKSTEFEEERLGEEIYVMATRLIPNDPSLAEKVTGMVLETDHETLKHLVDENPKELSRRVEQAVHFLRKGSEIDNQKNERSMLTTDKDSTAMRTISGCLSHNNLTTYRELCTHLKKFYPDSEAEIAADALLKLNKKDLDAILHSPVKLESFIRELIYTDNQTEEPKFDMASSGSSIDSYHIMRASQNSKWYIYLISACRPAPSLC